MAWRLPRIGSSIFCFGLSCVLLNTPPASAKVEVVGDAQGGYQMLVDGEPFVIRGGGGDGDKALLAATGGNSFRTWGVGDDTPAKLAEAREHGLKVALGFWLGHERHGFDYGDADALAAQKAMVREGVLRHRNDPAVLMWVLGNEMEGFDAGDDPRIWDHVQELAAMVKRLDPTRPTMTVTAEIGGKRVEMVNRCPDIDIHGINSYAGGPSIPQRYREAGGRKPYLLSEFGPGGTWEVGRTSFGAAPELTSTQKADVYRRVWETVVEGDPLCLGGYAFTWGHKQEATATWFGMFLADGSKLGAVDAMHRAWTGSEPANRCPVVEPLEFSTPDSIPAGGTFRVELTASDPDGDPLEVEWKLKAETDEYRTGGDREDPTAVFDDAIVSSSHTSAKVRLPGTPGTYRVFVFVRDGKGAAATANKPIEARAVAVRTPVGKDNPDAPRRADLPLRLYTGDMRTTPFVPSGYMGGVEGIDMDPRHAGDPKRGDTCLRVNYDGTGGWAGVVWQSPPNDWGEKPGGYNLQGATTLRFWARGERGGETIKFGYGVLGRDTRYYDTAKGETEVTLTTDWQRFTLDLRNRDLSRIKTGFMWVADAPVTFYLDEIAYQ